MMLQVASVEAIDSERKVPRTISYGCISTPFGPALLFVTDEKICGLYLSNDSSSILKEMKEKWNTASFNCDSDAVELFAKGLFQMAAPSHLLLKGTTFQLNCWQSLLLIPFGGVSHYEEVALRAGYPKAIRATASAVAKNPVSLLIPCHRVIYKSGEIGKYRWGSFCKKKILEWESSKA